MTHLSALRGDRDPPPLRAGLSVVTSPVVDGVDLPEVRGLVWWMGRVVVNAAVVRALVAPASVLGWAIRWGFGGR
jgi:hypothetical protein